MSPADDSRVTLVADNPGPVPLAGVGGTGLTVAGIRAAETERADRLFADPLAGAFVAVAGSPPCAPAGSATGSGSPGLAPTASSRSDRNSAAPGLRSASGPLSACQSSG